jgi:hypothetical protein
MEGSNASNWNFKDTGMSITWDALADEERTALKRMNRGPYPGLSAELGERLIQLGLAARRPNGVGISREGREMVIGALLSARLALDE